MHVYDGVRCDGYIGVNVDVDLYADESGCVCGYVYAYLCCEC